MSKRPIKPPPKPRLQSMEPIRSHFLTKLVPGDYIVEIPYIMSVAAEEKLLDRLYTTFGSEYKFFILSGIESQVTLQKVLERSSE